MLSFYILICETLSSMTFKDSAVVSQAKAFLLISTKPLCASSIPWPRTQINGQNNRGRQAGITFLMMKKFRTQFIICSKAVIWESPRVSVWPFELESLIRNSELRGQNLRRLTVEEHVKHTRLQPFRIPFGRLASTFMKNALRSSEIWSKSLLLHHPLITSSS